MNKADFLRLKLKENDIIEVDEAHVGYYLNHSDYGRFWIRLSDDKCITNPVRIYEPKSVRVVERARRKNK